MEHETMTDQPKERISVGSEGDAVHAKSEAGRQQLKAEQTIRVSNIPFDQVSMEELRELLLVFGKIMSLKRLVDEATHRPRDTVLCKFEDMTPIDVAVDSLNGLKVGNSRLKAQIANYTGEHDRGVNSGVETSNVHILQTHTTAPSLSDNHNEVLPPGKSFYTISPWTQDELASIRRARPDEDDDADGVSICQIEGH